MVYNNSDKDLKSFVGNKNTAHKKAQVAFDDNKKPFKPIYRIEGNFNELNKYDKYDYLLNMFKIIIKSKNDPNDIINFPFVKLFTEINDDLTEALISFIGNINLELKRKPMSTLGEYLFFAFT